MTCGLPVFATNRGGPAEILVDKQSGFHIDPFAVRLSDPLQLVAVPAARAARSCNAGLWPCREKQQIFTLACRSRELLLGLLLLPPKLLAGTMVDAGLGRSSPVTPCTSCDYNCTCMQGNDAASTITAAVNLKSDILCVHAG